MSPADGQDRVEVYAVVRVDHFLGPSASLQDRVTVKEVLPDLEEAKAEVDRLNALATERDYEYFWQYSRFYPSGRRS